MYPLVVLLLLPPGLLGAEAPNSDSRVTIPDGTAVHLRLTHTVSSLHARVGDPLDFLVEDAVTVGDHTIIGAGSVAHGSVLGVKGRRILGVGGKIVYGLDSVALVTGETVGLSARRVVKGQSHVWRMIAGAALTALVFLPATPIFLLTRGGTSTLLKGTEVTAQIDCDASVRTAGLPHADKSAAGIDQMLVNLPPRVSNREGREGDMVNLIFVGQKDDLQGAFSRAGWVKTDPWNPVMAWHLLTRRMHDANLPMARFYMFGRVQDYSYALPDPDAIMARRHHIRIWRTQYTMDGNPLWAAAASYDQAIEFAKSGHIINHSIDPNVDNERDFVGSDMGETSPARKEYLNSDYPVFEAQTTSGEDYHSDSRILLVDLRKPRAATVAVDTSKSGPAHPTSVLTPISGEMSQSSTK